MVQQYKVVRGALKLPRGKNGRKFAIQSDFVMQGELIPEGVLNAEQVSALVESGRLIAVQDSAPEDGKGRRGRKSKPKSKGKWSVDPKSCAGKSLEELLVMVLEIDPEFNVDDLDTEAKVLKQLTKDWDAAFTDTPALADDRVSAARLGASGAKDAGDVPLAPAAQAALEDARERAAAPEQA